MNILDFLNSSPQYSIFQKEINKTDFGGILFILYIIIMIIISLAYILDFALNNKYEIESYTIDTLLEIEQDWFNIDGIIEKNPEINPMVDLSVQVRLDYNEFYSSNTTNLTEIFDNLYLVYDKKFIKGVLYYCANKVCIKFEIKKKVYDTEGYKQSIDLLFKCNDTLCSNYPQYIYSLVAISTKDFEINHDSSIPVSTSDCDCFAIFWGCRYRSYGEIHDNETLYLTVKISSIYYEEKKGISRLFDKIMNKTNKYTITYIENEKSSVSYNNYDGYFPYNFSETENLFQEEEYDEEGDEAEYEGGEGWERDEEWEKKLQDYKTLAILITKPFGKYQIYRRSEISFLTVLEKYRSFIFHFLFCFFFYF